MTEKPNNISYEIIHDVLYAAHESTREQGIQFFTSSLIGRELEERIGKDGKCFVALVGYKVVGTVSVSMSDRNTWYANGRTASLKLLGVVPEFTGKHISSLLIQKVIDYATNMGATSVILDTAKENKQAISIYLHKGFHLVGYLSPKNANHYSVVCAHFLNNRKVSKLYCKMRFAVEKAYICLRFKPHHIKRFGI